MITSYKFFHLLTRLNFIEEIWLYGSRARGDHHDRSDIDLAIVCPTASDDDWREVMMLIENADTLFKIDCVRFDQLNDEDVIKKNITKDKKVIFQRKKFDMHPPLLKDYIDSLGKALDRLREVLDLYGQNPKGYLQDAAIQRFEFSIELFWKVLKKILTYEGVQALTPREVLKQSFHAKLINEESL